MAVLIVAELGINHGGSVDTALRMVAAAAEAGCDAIKVQAYRCRDFLPEGHPDWQMFHECELSWADMEQIGHRAHGHGLKYGITPTSVEGVQRAVEVGADYLKNGSDFLLRHDVIRAMAATKLPTVLGTGMATYAEVRDALLAYYRDRPRDFRREPAGPQPTLLVCTSEYPCRDEDAKLGVLRRGWNGWPLYAKIGYSDHTLGHVAAVAAVALGATMVEKHFTLDDTADGPDHWFSATPAEMALLVAQAERVESMLGDGNLKPTPSELENRNRWRVTEDRLRAA